MANLFQSDNALIQQDLRRIEQVITSPNFLSGLVINSKKSQLTKTFIQIDNIIECHKRIGSEEVYDLPEPWPYQCFNEILEEEERRILFKIMPYDKVQEIEKLYFTSNYKEWDQCSFNIIEDRYKALNVKKSLKKIAQDSEELNTMIWVYENSFLEIIDAIFALLIRSACIGGLKNSPIAKRMLEAFEAGGIPGGWVGPLPQDGGEANNCLQLFHLGK